MELAENPTVGSDAMRPAFLMKHPWHRHKALLTKCKREGGGKNPPFGERPQWAERMADSSCQEWLEVNPKKTVRVVR